MATTVATASVWEDSTPILLARVSGLSGNDTTPVTIASISTLTYTVRDSKDEATEIVGGSLTPANVWFDTLQTGDIWTVDSTGFNFKYQLEATGVPNGDTKYLVDLTLTLTDGSVEKWRYELTTRPHYA